MSEFSYQIDKKENSLYFIGDINYQSINELFQCLNSLEKDKNNTSANLYLTSNGGICTEGLKMYDVLQNTNLNLNIFSLGFVGSAATLALFTKHKTFIYKNSVLGFHESSSYIDHRYSNATSSLNFSGMLLDKFIQIYNSKSKEITKEWLIVDKYIDSTQALNMNIVDEII